MYILLHTATLSVASFDQLHDSTFWRLAPDLRNVCVENAHLAVRQPYVPGRSGVAFEFQWWSTKKWDCVPYIHYIYDINGRLMETGKKNELSMIFFPSP